MILFRVLVLFSSSLLLLACNYEKTQNSPIKASDSVIEKQTEKVSFSNTVSNEDVVAIVNNDKITRSQLDHAMDRLLPKKISSKNKEKLSEKVLDSLIDSRLMAVLEEAKLDEQARQLINTKVDAFREELLVKKYIVENIEPQPITQKSIYQYYLKHQDDFGAGFEKTFEIIQSKEGLKEHERMVLLNELSKLPKIDNWLEWYKDHKQLGISYKNTISFVKLLKEPLKEIVDITKDGETSPLLNEKVLTIVRVNKSKKIPAQPFEKVSREIRQMMAPQALKKSIKSHLNELKKNASIEKNKYENTHNNSENTTRKNLVEVKN